MAYCSKMHADQLQNLQNRAARIITKADYSVRSCNILEELKWPTLNDRRTMQMNIMMYKVYHAAVLKAIIPCCAYTKSTANQLYTKYIKTATQTILQKLVFSNFQLSQKHPM